jgi:hypothetical protein
MKSVRSVPYLDAWKQLLAHQHDAGETGLIAERIQQRYAALQCQKPQASNSSQRRRLDRLLLPGLALYQALREANLPQDESLAETERLFKATFFLNERRFTAWLNRLPNPFPIVRILLRLIERAAHAEAEHEIVEDSSHCFAFNAHRCFLTETLHFYHAPELAPVYCKTDDWMAEAMPKVRWLRTKTLGRGDAICDFRWENRRSDQAEKCASNF